MYIIKNANFHARTYSFLFCSVNPSQAEMPVNYFQQQHSMESIYYNSSHEETDLPGTDRFAY